MLTVELHLPQENQSSDGKKKIIQSRRVWGGETELHSVIFIICHNYHVSFSYIVISQLSPDIISPIILRLILDIFRVVGKGLCLSSLGHYQASQQTSLALASLTAPPQRLLVLRLLYVATNGVVNL